MPRYNVNVSATTNSTLATEDSFVELTAASGSEIHIYHFTISVETAASDDTFSWRLVRKSAAGSTGVSFTPVKRNPGMRASSVTAKVKDAANAFTTGTVTDVMDQGAFNGRGLYDWVARKGEEEWVIAGSGIGGILVKCSAASKIVRCDMDYED